MNLAPSFNQHFPDAPGGFLYAYESGTVTPQTTYANQAGTTTNDNPIELDSTGRCDLWLIPAVEYTFVLKDEDDVTIKTWDDVGGVATGTAAVTSVNTFTGAVTLTADDLDYTTGTVTEWFDETDITGALDAIINKVDDVAADVAALTLTTYPVPTGAIVAFGTSTVPSGWLECNGQAVSRTTYAALFTAIGILAGAGDGTTTFNVPDYRGEYVRGWDHGRAVDAGRALLSTQAGVIPSHRHLNGVADDLGLVSVYDPVATDLPGDATSQVDHSGATIAYQGNTSYYGTGTENIVRNVAAMYCIRT